MQSVKPSFVYDALQSLIDTIEMQPDPAARLAAYTYLAEKFEERVLKSRDKAAYEARLQYAAADISDVCGSDVREVYYWADRHRVRSGLPPIKRRQRQDVSAARSIVDVLGVDRRDRRGLGQGDG